MDEKFKFGLLALVVILFQSCLKLYGVLLTGSLSFLSETVDTFTDIIFVSITLVAIRQSEKPPDYEHMYGHSKIDSIGAMVQGIILVGLYMLLIYNAFQVLLSGRYTVSNPLAGLQILIISFCVNITFSRFLMWQGKKRKSLTLEIQGLNLFQDSMRAVLVFVSFIFILFNITFLDIFISITLSIWIIFGAIKLTKEGINELEDVNPINSVILEELRNNIFSLDHVNGVEDLRVRATGRNLFLEVNLSVEDHISIIHANHIISSIKAMSHHLFPAFQVEHIIQMNPLSTENLLGENVINLIYSLKADYPQILEIKELNFYSFKEAPFLSLVIVVDDKLSLTDAHNVCTQFENELKEQVPSLKRIITHIEASESKEISKLKEIECKEFSNNELDQIKLKIETILKQNQYIKGYHGLECWNTVDSCFLEIHVFFDGTLNISDVHNMISILEIKIKKDLSSEGIREVILHSEPFKAEREGTYF